MLFLCFIERKGSTSLTHYLPIFTKFCIKIPKYVPINVPIHLFFEISHCYKFMRLVIFSGFYQCGIILQKKICIAESVSLANFVSIGIFEISWSVIKILANSFYFLTVHLQKNFKFLTYCDIRHCTNYFFYSIFLKQKRYQVINKWILTRIGQKITVRQSCKVAGILLGTRGRKWVKGTVSQDFWPFFLGGGGRVA